MRFPRIRGDVVLEATMPSTPSFSLRERFRFQSAALPDGEPLHVLRFSGEEGFSRIFSFDISLCTKRNDLD